MNRYEETLKEIKQQELVYQQRPDITHHYHTMVHALETMSKLTEARKEFPNIELHVEYSRTGTQNGIPHIYFSSDQKKFGVAWGTLDEKTALANIIVLALNLTRED